MHNRIALPLLPFFLCGLGNTVSQTQDCLMSVTPVQGSNGSAVVDTGSTTSTNGAGCDGCTVARINIRVTWAHTTWGWVNGLGGDFKPDSVTAGDVTTLSWRAAEALECGQTKQVSVIQPVPAGSGSGPSTLDFTCNTCQ